mmetsp:Transcript_29507/g.69435  ORF Transcript_29507/g.69435 Transcript_29507/m.69435 type:complete len:264 (-) Transcript_29507:4-795(-)
MCGPTTKSQKETIVSPVVPSGFARRKTTILASLVGFIVFYNALRLLFRDASSLLRPTEEFCKDQAEGEPCVRSDLFGKQATSAVVQLYLGGMGLFTWHIAQKVVTKIPQTPEGRLFGYLKEADHLNTAIVVYQTFDFLTSMTVPEHNNPVFLIHHLLAAVTAYMSLEHQMVHYYAVFFGGCSEISTVFLVLCDFDVYFPVQDPGSLWGMIIQFCQASFVLTFFYYRVIGWWKVSFQLWSDVFAVAAKGTIEDYRPGKGWFPGR